MMAVLKHYGYELPSNLEEEEEEDEEKSGTYIPGRSLQPTRRFSSFTSARPLPCLLCVVRQKERSTRQGGACPDPQAHRQRPELNST